MAAERAEFDPIESSRIAFEYDMGDSVLDRYKKRIGKANSEVNTQPVSAESDEGREMMAMIEEYSDMAEGLQGTDVRYSVDGGIGLSLRQLNETKSFLRSHRDFDVITPEEDLEKFNQAISNQEPGKQWGIFEVDEKAVVEKGKLILTPLSLEGGQVWKRLVALPVAENGAPDNVRYQGLTAIDIHYPKRNEKGTMMYNNRPVDEAELFEQEKVVLPNGSTTPVVGLKQMAINKSVADRPQDKIDLEFILNQMSPEEKAAFEKDPNRHRETTTVGKFTYNVEELKKHEAEIPETEMALEELAGAVAEGNYYWFDKNGEQLGPAQILADWEAAQKNEAWQEHVASIQRADLDKPIWITQEGHVFDGAHRLTRAFIEGRKAIKVKVWDKLPESAIVTSE